MAALPDNNTLPPPIPPSGGSTAMSVNLLLAGTGWVLVMTLMDLLLVGAAPLLLALRLAGLALPVWWWLDRRPRAWVAPFWLGELGLGQVVAIYAWADAGAPPVALAAGALCGFLLIPVAVAGGFRWRPAERGVAKTTPAAPTPPAGLTVPVPVLRLSMRDLQARLLSLSASLDQFATRQSDPAHAADLRALRSELDATGRHLHQKLGLETVSPAPSPVADLTPPPRAPAARPSPTVKRNLSVLLVDDEGVGRTLMRLLLERDGYAVEETDDAKMALEMALVEGPDIAFISARIGRHRGLALARCIHDGGGPPIWLLRGPADLISDRQRERAGLLGVLDKPVTPAALADALDRLGNPAPMVVPGDKPAPVPPPQPYSALLDMSVLEEHLDLLGRGRVAHIIASFLATAPETLGLAATAAQARDLVSLGRAAHKLAGGALTVGAAALAAQARKVEAAARAEDMETALATTDDLPATFQAAGDALSRFKRDRLDQAGG